MAAIIVAVDENNGIGFNGNLLEHIPEDLKNFQKLTIEGGYVIMGRKTYDSLPHKPLPNRRNYIITRTPPDSKNETEMVQYISMEEAKKLIKLTEGTFMDNILKFFVIGGGLIYKELLPYCREVYMTKILKTHENVDTYFPILSDEEWSGQLLSQGKYKDIQYQFWHYRRK